MAYYDGMIKVDLSKITPMIAMPFHPSNTYTIEETKRESDGRFGRLSKRGAAGQLWTER